jgi:hypothetical protein
MNMLQLLVAGVAARRMNQQRFLEHLPDVVQAATAPEQQHRQTAAIR